MRSIGTGGSDGNPYIEWVAVYPESTLYQMPGAPSLRFSDQAPDDPNKPRDFEIGFYKYGPTWYTKNSIIEFWIGGTNEDGTKGGIFSVAGNDDGGGEIQVRNPTDTDSIQLLFHDAAAPTIKTESGLALHFQANQGLISDNLHTFAQEIAIPPASGYSGQVLTGNWQQGAVTVAAPAVAADDLVLITPLSQPRGQWWVSQVTSGESFTVSSSDAAETMSFNWLIVAAGAS